MCWHFIPLHNKNVAPCEVMQGLIDPVLFFPLRKLLDYLFATNGAAIEVVIVM
jgi:hypothetical protein